MDENTVKVYNLGARVVIFKGGRCLPKKVTNVPEADAKRLFKMYPKELIEWGKELPSEPKKASKMTLAEARALVAAADAENAASVSETGSVAPVEEVKPAEQADASEAEDSSPKKSKSKGKK